MREWGGEQSATRLSVTKLEKTTLVTHISQRHKVSCMAHYWKRAIPDLFMLYFCPFDRVFSVSRLGYFVIRSNPPANWATTTAQVSEVELYCSKFSLQIHVFLWNMFIWSHMGYYNVQMTSKYYNKLSILFPIQIFRPL